MLQCTAVIRWQDERLVLAASVNARTRVAILLPGGLHLTCTIQGGKKGYYF